MTDIGKLEKVNIRSVWPTEPAFTKWLEQNPELLSETLGITVEKLVSEQSTGNFFVDLVGEDGTGGNLIVENQFGKSDHDHLGKVMTYLAAFEATTAIWIVETPRAEHIKAFAWLNDASSANFYLVKMQALRIGASPAAPLLTLIVGPSEEHGKVSSIKKEMAESDRLRLQFWSGLQDKLKAAQVALHANLNAKADSWLATGAGVSGLSFTYVLGNSNSRVELYIDSDSGAANQAMFEQLLQHREQIDETFSQGTSQRLEWQPLEGKKAKRIGWTTTCGLTNPDSWPALQDELIDAMGRLSKAFAPYIGALKS